MLKVIHGLKSQDNSQPFDRYDSDVIPVDCLLSRIICSSIVFLPRFLLLHFPVGLQPLRPVIKTVDNLRLFKKQRP